MRGATAIEIKDLAGHQSIATTNRYMHLAPQRRRTAMALLETRRGEGVARSS
jgi:site-specific recombinase XerD